MTDKNGELSKIGRQNLKFCIEQSYQRVKKETNSILGFFQTRSDSSDSLNKISLLSTQINESQSEGKEERKKFLENEGNIDKNDEKHDDVKIDFKEDEIIFQKRRKCRKVTAWVCLILTIIAIITMFIIFLYK